jgi:hypothetical protein
MNSTDDIKIVLLHDDPVSGVRGTSVLERVAGQLEADRGKVDTEVWKFDVLRHPGLREHAAARIREADMIVISAAGSGELPDHVQSCLETGLSRRSEREAAMVALLDQESAHSGELPRLVSRLRQVAARFGLGFFCNHRRTASRKSGSR